MKKYAICLLLCTLMVCLSGCTIEIAGKTFTIGKEDVQTEEDIGTHYVEDKWYTRDITKWKQMYPEEEITYISNYDTRSKTEYFVLDMMQKSYIEVKLPGDYQYVNTGTEIRSTNGAIKLNIYKGSVGSDIEVPNEYLYSKTVKYTSDGDDILHCIVKNLENDYTVVAQVGSNSNDWSFIRDMVIDIDVVKTTLSENIEYKLGVPTYDTSILQSVFPTNEYAVIPTIFKEGYITILNSAYDFEGNVDCALMWLSTVSDGTDITVYKNATDETLFAETVTGYSLSIFRNNDQYFFITYGRGDEARANNIMMLYDKE